MPTDPEPWSVDLTTPAGREELAQRVARAPAVALAGPPELPPGRPRLVVDVRGTGAGVVVALDHVLRPSREAGRVLRRRLAVAGFEDPRDPGLEGVVLLWSILARSFGELEAEGHASFERAQRLSRALRRP